VLYLECPLGHIIADRITGNIVQCFLRRLEVRGAFADDNGQFHLPVHFLGSGRNHHVVKGANHGVGVLEEENRDRRRGVTGFCSMGGVVLADAKNRPRLGDGRADAQRCRAFKFRKARLECVAYPGDAIVGEKAAVDISGQGPQIEVFPVFPGYRQFLPGFAQAHEFHYSFPCL
jgi:hypothetical protein